MNSFLRTYGSEGSALQRPADVAVVIPTLLRPSLGHALRSIFEQRFDGRIHVLVGVDVPAGEAELLDEVCQERPANCIVQAIYPGFSTSARHGGLTPAHDGGALRTVLTYLANSPLVAYLDDDNWWHPDHLARLTDAIDGTDWAYALRWFVDPVTDRPICVDRWESVGPGRGVFRNRFGGFVDPSCLMINKLRCAEVIPLWRQPLASDQAGMSADRTVFERLSRNYRGAGTGEATVFYQLDPGDANHVHRMRWLAQAGLEQG